MAEQVGGLTQEPAIVLLRAAAAAEMDPQLGSPSQAETRPFICRPGTSKYADPNLVTVALAAERRRMSGWSCSSSTPTRAVIRKQHPQEGETHTVPTNEPLCQNLCCRWRMPSLLHICVFIGSCQFRFSHFIIIDQKHTREHQRRDFRRLLKQRRRVVES